MFNTGMKSITGVHLQHAPQHLILGEQGEMHPLWEKRNNPSFSKIRGTGEETTCTIVKHLSHTHLHKSNIGTLLRPVDITKIRAKSKTKMHRLYMYAIN